MLVSIRYWQMAEHAICLFVCVYLLAILMSTLCQKNTDCHQMKLAFKAIS